MHPGLFWFFLHLRKAWKERSLTITSCSVRQDSINTLGVQRTQHLNSTQVWPCLLPNAGRSDSDALRQMISSISYRICSRNSPGHSCAIVGHKILHKELIRDSLGSAGGAARAAQGSASAEMLTKPMALSTSQPEPSCPHLMAIGTGWLLITLLQNSWNTS